MCGCLIKLFRCVSVHLLALLPGCRLCQQPLLLRGLVLRPGRRKDNVILSTGHMEQHTVLTIPDLPAKMPSVAAQTH